VAVLVELSRRRDRRASRRAIKAAIDQARREQRAEASADRERNQARSAEVELRGLEPQLARPRLSPATTLELTKPIYRILSMVFNPFRDA